MNKKKLNKISGGKYAVDNMCCTTYKGKKICNFYIKDFRIIRYFDVVMKFMITLKSAEEESTRYIPIELLNSPSMWISAYFDLCSYKKHVTNNLFDLYMGEIIDLIIENFDEEDLIADNICGWNVCEYQDEDEDEYEYEDEYEDEYEFEFYGNRDEFYQYLDVYDRNVLSAYINSPYAETVIPIIAYTFLSVLSSLSILGENNRVNIIMSLTGSNEIVRNKLALLFANLFERSKYLSSAYYRRIHVYSDNKTAQVKMKSMRCKDSVLIAFNPHKKQCNTLFKIYSPFEKIDDNINSGLLLIVTADYNDIPFKTVNITIPDDFDIDGCEKMMYFEPNLDEIILFCKTSDIDYADLLMLTVYSYAKNIEYNLDEHKKSIQILFRQYNAGFKVPYNLTEEANNYTKLLLFPLWLYFKFTTVKNANDIFQRCVDIIANTARNSFPAKKDVLDSDLDQALAICKAFDTYFTKKSHHQYIGIIGVMPPNANEIKVWCDERHIFVKAKTLSEILKLQDCKYKFTLKTKRALAQRQIIETYCVSESKRPEYTVHMQKPLYDKVKSRARFIAFKRLSCPMYGLLDSIEHIACSKSHDLKKNAVKKE